MKTVTLKDIAKVAQVSVNTVSRALNNRAEISAATRERICRVAKDLKYRPNVLAQSFRTTRTKAIGAVISDNSNPAFAKILRGIEDTTHADGGGYRVILYNTDEDPERELEAIRLLAGFRVAGVLFTPTRSSTQGLNELQDLGIPFVLLCRKIPDIEASAVVCDDVVGATIGTACLIRCGHRRIGMIGGIEGDWDAEGRHAGYLEALASAGLPYDPAIVRRGAFNSKSGYAAMRDILREPEPPSAVSCFSDYVATGAIQAALEIGLRIPTDVAVVGFDDIEFAAHLRVPLTTVRNPLHAMGVEATKLLLSFSEEPLQYAKEIVLEPELVTREST